jgi:glucose-6-phosphate isomerase
VEPGVTSGDYLSGFHQGTRRALHENGRESITLTIDEVNAERLGELIALYERAVGLYAWLININAYNQPGVQAGKKAADAVLALQNRIIGHLRENRGHRYTAEKLAKALGVPEETETVFKILRHLAANSDHGIHCEAKGDPFKDRYYA